MILNWIIYHTAVVRCVSKDFFRDTGKNYKFSKIQILLRNKKLKILNRNIFFPVYCYDVKQNVKIYMHKKQ